MIIQAYQPPFSNIRGHIDVFNIYDESGSCEKFILMDISLMTVKTLRVFFLSDIPDWRTIFSFKDSSITITISNELLEMLSCVE